MKVSEVLNIPALEGCHLIAGESGTSREILHVNMMDAPDIARFLKPNELLVTTAYHVKDDPEQLIDLLEAMAEQGCAALGIKTQRFLKAIPERVLDLADKLAFPVIELPNSTSLGDIVNQTLSSILDKRTNELRFAIDTHKQFSKHIMSGKGIQKLLENLADLVALPVVLLDSYAKPIAFSHTDPNHVHEMESLYLRNAAALFPNTPFFTFSTIKNRQTFSVFLVYTHEKKAGFLIALGEIHPHNHSATLTIEQATNVISFELMKENALKQYSRRVRNEFFLNFTEGHFSSDEEIVNRAREFQLENDQNYYCAAGKLEVHNAVRSYTHNQKEFDTIYEYIEEELVSLSLSTNLFTRGDLCILLFQVKEASKETAEFVQNSLQVVQKMIEVRFGRSISFGVSNISRNFLNVSEAYNEAQDALQTGKLSGKSGFIHRYQTKDIMELLRTVPKDDLKEFYYNCLHQFTRAGEDEEQTLLHTLFVYLETHCQISETAKRLFVHRNTVVYRLEKCEELLGKSLSDPEMTLQIRLALRIKTMLDL
ncbi:PucR family transcriptional regulator [Sediminibacillus massiliensis]|uniref:PucR family transcriptional regulator n=1 Tax=Sediminibacillus massiliensis TaxID=1926277 RepID=UPI000988552E|nr:PucR family transcriptional regulator [Sediminibacillus massiliensis]